VTGIVTRMSEIIIVRSVMTGILYITGLGIQRKGEMIDVIVTVADTDALSLIIGTKAQLGQE
jgi:hypothetical protein